MPEKMNKKRPDSTNPNPSKRSKTDNIGPVSEQQTSRMDLIAMLDEKISKQELVELHTHLLGMGSADFWVHWIMATFLPKVCKYPPSRRKEDYKEKDLVKTIKKLLNDQLKGKKFQKSDVKELFKLGFTKLEILKFPENADVPDFSIAKSLKEFLSLIDTKTRLARIRETFTDDVVYSEETLLNAFGITGINGRANLECRLYNPKLKDPKPFKKFFRSYIIFNARKQEFQYIQHGVRNQDLLNLMGIGDDHQLKDVSSSSNPILSQVRNCFSMLNQDGTVPRDLSNSSIIISNYRGNFTPEFTRRFKMKDSIYQQRLEVLSILLNRVIARYSQAGVSYVEFSLGMRDLMNIHIWKHIENVWSSPPTIITKPPPKEKPDKESKESNPKLLPNKPTSQNKQDLVEDSSSKIPKPLKLTTVKPHWRQFLPYYNAKPLRFQFVFLAAVPRSKIEIDDEVIEDPTSSLQLLLEDKSKELLESRFLADNGELDKNIQAIFPHLFNENSHLSRLEKELEKGPTDEKNLFYYWKNYVVGFDLVGDETGFPYCPLAHSRFLRVVKEMRRFGTKRFGIRLHGGESVPRGSSLNEIDDKKLQEAFLTHMKILHHSLMRIQREIGNRLRVGHGVAFLVKNNDIVKAGAKWLADNGIVCELNMTSNAYLLTDTYHSESTPHNGSCQSLTLREFLDYVPAVDSLDSDPEKRKLIPVTLSTDDDGIWPIHKCPWHYRHISVAAEYCKAIMLDAIKTKDELEKLIQNARDAAFL